MNQRIDLGHGHALLRYLAWRPDRALNPQYMDLPDIERYSAIVSHRRLNGSGEEECEGVITFASDVQRRLEPGVPHWTVDSWEPLTLSPSLLCHCGDHGYIRNGQWVPA